MTVVLIDTDIIPYEIGFVMEKDGVQDWPVVQSAVDNRLEQIKAGVSKRFTDVNTVELLLSDPAGNFRTPMGTIKPYKGHRTKPKPVHWNGIRAYLRDIGAYSFSNLEGDDAILIQKKEHLAFENVVIASRDKDFNQSVGLRYSWSYGDNPEQWWDVSERMARISFWSQMLTGDTADNILGLHGIGPAAACVKRLHMIDTHREMAISVKEEYVKRFGNYWKDFFSEHLVLLKLVEDLRYPPQEFAARWFRKFFTEEEALEFFN